MAEDERLGRTGSPIGGTRMTAPGGELASRRRRSRPPSPRGIEAGRATPPPGVCPGRLPPVPLPSGAPGQVQPVVLRPEDAGAVAALAARCFPEPWSEALWRAELEREVARVWGVPGRRPDRWLQAVVDFWVLRDEVHVLNLATDPDRRRRGLASALLACVLRTAEVVRARRVTLEVRRSNAPAQRLYRRFGFRGVGARPGYYDDGEDALLMLRSLPR